MTENQQSLTVARIRRGVADWLPFVALALLLVGGAGGWMTYQAHLSPGTHVETTNATAWSSTATYEHSAVVEEENAVYPVGESLTSAPLYYAELAPTLNGTYRFTYGGPAGSGVSVDATVLLVLRSAGGESTEYWNVTRELASAPERRLSPGESLSVPFSVDVPDATDRIDRVERSLGASPGETEALVVTTSHVEGAVDGRSVDRTVRRTLLIETGDGTYEVEQRESDRYASETTERVSVRNSYGPAYSAGGPLLSAVGLFGLCALAVATRRDLLSLDSDESRALARREFEEWITAGTVSNVGGYPRRVNVDTLDGLVDVAVDANGRVVEDTRRSAYFVVDGDVLYVHRG